jgi:hypothetical protein
MIVRGLSIPWLRLKLDSVMFVGMNTFVLSTPIMKPGMHLTESHLIRMTTNAIEEAVWCVLLDKTKTTK